MTAQHHMSLPNYQREASHVFDQELRTAEMASFPPEGMMVGLGVSRGSGSVCPTSCRPFGPLEVDGAGVEPPLPLEPVGAVGMVPALAGAPAEAAGRAVAGAKPGKDPWPGVRLAVGDNVAPVEAAGSGVLLLTGVSAVAVGLPVAATMPGEGGNWPGETAAAVLGPKAAEVAGDIATGGMLMAGDGDVCDAAGSCAGAGGEADGEDTAPGADGTPGQRPQVVWQYPPAGEPMLNMKDALHCPKDACMHIV